MGLNDTPSAERVHIGIFGRTNAGKSSIFNQLVNQDAAVVSDVKGTTTDPVTKAMELLPIGAVAVIDTPGLDDAGELGAKRIAKAKEMLRRTDIALLVIDAQEAQEECFDFLLERNLIGEMKKRGVPYLVILNKAEMLSSDDRNTVIARTVQKTGRFDGDDMAVSPVILYSTRMESFSADALRTTIASIYKEEERTHWLVADLVKPGESVILVVPIDESAPKGRLILPQQQVIRELIEHGAYPFVTMEGGLAEALRLLNNPPALIVTDSQAFAAVAKIVPRNLPLTSFSILQARFKGDLAAQVKGARAIGTLPNGSKVLIAEGCTHHRQCGDIGTVKLPGWIGRHTGKSFLYEFTSGKEFPEDLAGYDLVIHCGGCMLNPREMRYRISSAETAGVPVTNYGVLIAYLHGILDRVLEPFDIGK